MHNSVSFEDKCAFVSNETYIPRPKLNEQLLSLINSEELKNFTIFGISITHMQS